MKPFQRIPIPERMKKLPKDSRGYPIPFIVMRDNVGKPHFTINDTEKRTICICENRCAICGESYEHTDIALVGGPGSAFHKKGAYIDPPAHVECAEYACQVCPYLAAPSYARRIDDKLVKPENVAGMAIIQDEQMIPERPALFVMVVADKFGVVGIEQVSELSRGRGYIVPIGMKRVKFYLHGEEIDETRAVEVMGIDAVKELAQS